VPLGYDVKDRKLIVNEAEAVTVQLIFRRYAEPGSVALLKAELDRLETMSKRRQGAMGQLSNGKRFARGALYLMLQNRLYRGEVAHKGNFYPGQPRSNCRLGALAERAGQARRRPARALLGSGRRGAESLGRPRHR
jgi:hypothetical protein